MATAAAKGKKAGTAGGVGSVNIEVKQASKGGLDYTVGDAKIGMFSSQIPRDGAATAPPGGRAPAQKRKTARELVMDDMIEYHKKPNPKKLKELREKCANLNINFDQLLNKAKEA